MTLTFALAMLSAVMPDPRDEPWFRTRAEDQMKPRIGVLLGDPNGVGPEMAVKLLAENNVRERSEILVIGDVRVFRMAERVAGTTVSIRTIGDIAEADWNQNALPYEIYTSQAVSRR